MKGGKGRRGKICGRKRRGVRQVWRRPHMIRGKTTLCWLCHCLGRAVAPKWTHTVLQSSLNSIITLETHHDLARKSRAW